MKKIFFVFCALICVLCLSLCGCYAEEERPTNTARPILVGIHLEIFKNEEEGGLMFSEMTDGNENYDHILRRETQYGMRCRALQKGGGSQLGISAKTVELLYDTEALEIEALDPMYDEYIVTTKTKNCETTLIAITQGYDSTTKTTVYYTSTLKILIF